MAKSMTRIQILREFFYRPGMDTLTSFAAELKALTKEDREELTRLVAAQMEGVEIKVEA